MSTNHIKYHIQKAIISLFKVFFKITLHSRGFFHILFSYLFRIIRLFLTILKPIIIRFYILYLIPKRILLAVLKPATNKLRYLFSNRYISHFLLLTIAFFTLAGNLAAEENPSNGIGGSVFLKQIVNIEGDSVEEELVFLKKPPISSYFDENEISTLSSEETALGKNDFSPMDTVFDDTALLKPTISPVAIGDEEVEENVVKRTEIVEYIVQDGDTVSNIAEKFGIDTNTILWENKLGPRDYIRPGDILTILPINGIQHTIKAGDTLSKIALRYDIDIDKIMEVNRLTDTSLLSQGEKLIIPDAAPITPLVRKKTSPLQRIKDIFTPPSARIPAGTQMIWPTVGRRINQYFSWRHTGIDVDGDKTDPIYAADDGVVIKVGGGWSGGYGNHVKIDHGNGVITLYAHMSTVSVSPGQTVQKGEVLGMMGTTGRSTGVHLHFEVMSTRGARSNPFNYVQ